MSEPAVEELVFNPFLAEVRADPYPLYARLRSEDPIHDVDFMHVTVVTRHAEATAVLRDPRFTTDHRHADRPVGSPTMQRDPDLLERRSRVLLFMDPPAHTRIRKLVNKAFTPRTVERLEPLIAGIVGELLERAAVQGGMDLIADFAYPLPVRVISEMLGVPREDHETFKGWSAALTANLDPLVTPEMLARAMGAGDAFEVYFRELIARRRAQPRDDLVSALAAVEEEGDRLSEEEMLALCTLLLVAGHETTVNLIGNGVLALLRNPTELDRLRADQLLDGNAVEELLRYDSPVQLTGRTARTDADVAGRGVPRGRQVIVVLGAANRDPAVFADPDRLDLARANAHDHLAFGGGWHFCLGAALARTEGRIAIGTLVRRFPGLRLATNAVEWRETVTMRGPRALPVAL